MKRKISIIALITLLFTGLFVLWSVGWAKLPQKNNEIEQSTSALSNREVKTENNSTVPQVQVRPYKIESFVSELEIPWSIVFTSESRILVTERKGNVRVIENGILQPKPIKNFMVSSQSEEGLMGMALDPSYEDNKYIYFCLAYGNTAPIYDRVVRLTDKGDSLTNEKIIIDKLPAAQLHAGCRIKFGPDKKLYISTGDAAQKQIAQDLDSLGGKILRINADGTIPEDNPYAGSPVYSLGHRNIQGFDWHPKEGYLIATEHGPSGVDGPGGGDELNNIVKGKNYGWPVVSHKNQKEGYINPLEVWTPAIAPASGMFYSGKILNGFEDNYFFAMLRGAGIVRVAFDTGTNGEKVADYQKLSDVDVGRVREIVQGPDGYIYFATSNRDGRGKTRDGDDHIYRIVPALGTNIRN